MYINPQNSLINELISQELLAGTEELLNLANEVGQSTMSGQGTASHQAQVQQDLQQLKSTIQLLTLLEQISQEEAQLAQISSGNGGNPFSGIPINRYLPVPQMLEPQQLIEPPPSTTSGGATASHSAFSPQYAYSAYTLTTTETYGPTGSTKVTTFGIV
jgi:hypothetical protein